MLCKLIRLSGLISVVPLLLTTANAQTGNTNIWFGPGAGLNPWTTASNWTNATTGTLSGLLGGDDVKFFNIGGTTLSNINSEVLNNLAVGSLVFGCSNATSLHTVLIASGATLSITNTAGLAVGTPADGGAALSLTNTITGVGGTLVINNASANVGINQANSVGAPSRATLDLSGLGNLNINANRLGIGDGQFPGVPVNNRAGGNLILAKTNVITLAYTDTLANYQTAGKNAAIIMSRNSGNNPGIISLLQLGITNTINVDSLNIGMDKSGNNSTASHGVMEFNPQFAGQNPVANFYGAGGAGTRITWWSDGDGNSSSSSSNGGGGTNDFSLGTVNALVNVMSLARDAAASADAWAGPHKGVFIFTNGTVDVNTLIIGNQSLETGTSTAASMGVFDVIGGGALLKVNTLATLGTTTLTTAAGLNTRGILNVTNGTVYANTVAVGANSISNVINLVNGTLIVTNTLATNASGLFVLNVSNSTVGLTVAANGSLRALAQTLNTIGATNFIQLDPKPVILASYPQQYPLVKYTTWTGSNTFGLASIPAWAPGAILVSNGPNKSLDLSLPTDPRPVFTSQPSPYSGNPGDNVTSSFTVSIAAGSVTPLGYQWYYTNGVSTNLLSNGAGPSGLSTLSGATSANLQVANAQPGDNGGYFVVVTNLFGTNSSTQVLLTISASAIPPAITGPNSQTATNGITTMIANSVSGSPVPAVYWQYNGAPLAIGTGPSGSSTISGSTSSTLTISNPQYPGDQGTYSLIASNSAGLATNNTVLTVIVPPAITSQPVSIIVTNTQAASFTVVATGVPDPTYQWNKNGAPISSLVNNTATNATFSIASVSAGDTSTNYTVTITNPAGVTNSVRVSLTVNSTMATTVLAPGNGQTGVSYDTPLYVTFNATPVLRSGPGVGAIKIYNITSATPVDTLDLSQGSLQGRLVAGETFSTYPVIISGNTAAIYPHAGVLASNQTYYVTIDDGVFADTSGAYFAGITATNFWQFTTKAGGPANPANLVVAQDYSGDFATVQGALDSVPASNPSLVYVNVRNGIYTEVVEFKKSNVVLRGQSRNGTIIGYANNSLLNASTHFRMAMKVNANNIALDNLTITNSTAQDLSQAEALMIETSAQQVIVNNCNVDSYQDTILANTSTSKAYFKSSLIQGDVDFIWGGGNLFFTNCEVRWLIRPANAAAVGPNPSPGTSDISSNGFSFVNCALTTLAGANPNDTVGRTRSITNGNTALINCFVSTNIGGWSADAVPTNLYRNWYYGCTNDLGASVTLSNGIALPVNDPNLTNASSSTIWLYGWVPQLAPNITSQPGNQSVSAGQMANFSVSATGIPDPTYQWLKNGSPISGATSSTFAIPSAVRTNTGNYSVVVNNGSGTVTSSVATLTYTGNVAPVANPASMVRPAGYSLKMSVPDLSTNWSDADGDAIALTATISSTNGATVSYDSNYVYYSNPNNVDDQINYTIGDGQGGIGAGVINLTISTNPVAGTPQTIAVIGSSATLNFAGIPTYQYEIQRSTNMAAWVTILTTNAPANGLFQFIDTFTDLGGIPPATAFYRTAQP